MLLKERVKNIKPKLPIFAVIILGIAFLIFWGGSRKVESPKPALNSLDEFAQCLTEKGVVMYGADWCPHCHTQKTLFGDSFRYISYVECPQEPQRCQEAGIEAFPTWTFSDGKKLVGTQRLDQLALASGCVIPR